MLTLENSNQSFSSDSTDNDTEIGYPIHVSFVELANMYMQRVQWHWHTEIEVIIVNHGAVDFMTDDDKIRLKAGQGILVNQNIMHSIMPVDSDYNCSLYSTTFHPSFLFGYGNTQMSGKYLAPILSSPVFRTMFLDEQDHISSQLMDLVNSVIAVNMTKKYGYELVTKSYLCQLWVILLEHVIPQNVQKHRSANLSMDESRVKEAILYIEDHYAERITLDDLSASIHISKSECCRCFKRTLQITPIEYLMKYRIFKAANMIQKEDLRSRSISELAFSVGFNNASYFNKVFRQFMNCTPSEYKRSVQNDPVSNPFQSISI
ncbi:MAG: AraC family transcriptional regulator [Lachnospiraceae bacterium]|nr:AraC family transcriptional regulator [Lachnospiraceae bacterium]